MVVYIRDSDDNWQRYEYEKTTDILAELKSRSISLGDGCKLGNMCKLGDECEL